ncbi:MAG TPA: two-component system response regulator [Lachnospiraceae bacterium]|nr:two-component system response regulator [Lachnospiraceae bacterium]
MSDIDKNKPVVLVVDDVPDNITLLSGLLKEYYQVKVALNGEKAIAMVRKSPPDIILLDVMMPVMDGYETCRILKANDAWKDIPVIFLTTKNEVEDESRGFSYGAADYIAKPVNPVILLSRIKTHLTLKQASDFLKNKNQYLEEEISRRTQEVGLIQEVSIMAMAALAETRDNETGYHIQRTKLYVKELCGLLRNDSAYADQMQPALINLIVTSAPLHDIGKVGIPDAILLKPGKLTEEEFEVMKTHTTLGRDAIMKAEQLMNRPETFLLIPKEIAYSHHEKWNGTGYPQGLSGMDIPLSARILALADVYDALISKRVYKPPFPHEKAVGIIREDSGRHFDPEIVRVFLKNSGLFHEIAETYKDI